MSLFSWNLIKNNLFLPLTVNKLSLQMDITVLDALIGTEPLLVCIQSKLFKPDMFVHFKFCLGERLLDNTYYRKSKTLQAFYKCTFNLIYNMKAKEDQNHTEDELELNARIFAT